MIVRVSSTINLLLLDIKDEPMTVHYDAAKYDEDIALSRCFVSSTAARDRSTSRQKFGRKR
jgi:hypothetical protein